MNIEELISQTARYSNYAHGEKEYKSRNTHKDIKIETPRSNLVTLRFNIEDDFWRWHFNRQ